MSLVPPTRRDGELSEESLVNALMEERRQGRRPTLLACGDRELEQTALRILAPYAASALDALRGIVPNVQIDDELNAGEWELREG